MKPIQWIEGHHSGSKLKTKQNKQKKHHQDLNCPWFLRETPSGDINFQGGVLRLREIERAWDRELWPAWSCSSGICFSTSRLAYCTVRLDVNYLKRIRKSRGNYISTYDNQLYEEYFHQTNGLLSSPKEGEKRTVQGNKLPVACQTYRGDGIGLGPMLQQNVDDVSVALLSSLVKRGVPILLSTVVTAKGNKEQEAIIRSDISLCFLVLLLRHFEYNLWHQLTQNNKH